jgi:hypothetical protein
MAVTLYRTSLAFTKERDREVRELMILFKENRSTVIARAIIFFHTHVYKNRDHTVVEDYF